MPQEVNGGVVDQVFNTEIRPRLNRNQWHGKIWQIKEEHSVKKKSVREKRERKQSPKSRLTWFNLQNDPRGERHCGRKNLTLTWLHTKGRDVISCCCAVIYRGHCTEWFSGHYRRLKIRDQSQNKSFNPDWYNDSSKYQAKLMLNIWFLVILSLRWRVCSKIYDVEEVTVKTRSKYYKLIILWRVLKHTVVVGVFFSLCNVA